ncbi:MAG: zinc ribbon domain-containing protein [Candidatus Geothermincolia bacterium]
MICVKCGAENRPDADYCTLCYAPLDGSDDATIEAPAAEKRRGLVACPNCDAPISLEQGFCGRCGYQPGAGECEELLPADVQAAPRVEPVAGSPEMEVTAETDGAELLRWLSARLGEASRPVLRMRGRAGISYGMKLLARLTGEMEACGRTLWLRAVLSDEEPVLHLDDVDILLELAVAGSGQ